MSNVIEHDQVKAFQFLSRMKALKLEISGLGRRGRSAYAICKEVYGFRGNRKSVLAQMESQWEKMKQETAKNESL